MAFVPGYKYDIFISYAHLDNQRMFDKGWVEVFHKSLEWFLSERTGKLGEINIWWDNKKLDGTKIFDTTIQEGIAESAIMISIVSRFYLESEYCNLEMELFSKKVDKEDQGMLIGDRSRMVHILLQNIHFSEWPSYFKGRTGFPFYHAPDASRLGDTIRSSSPEFITQMGILRDSIEELLKEFKQIKESGNTETKVEPEKVKDSFSIFFSEVPDTLSSLRKRCIHELNGKGYSTLTGNFCNSLDEHKRQTNKLLQQADLSVHLLDYYPGREIPGQSSEWYSKTEAELALKSTKPVLIWTPVLNLNEIEDPVYKVFVEQIASGDVSASDIEILHDPKSMLPQLIADHADALKIKKQAELVRQQFAGDKRINVLIDTNYEDQISAWDLGKALLENGIQPIINPGEGNPRDNIAMLGERMNQVQKLIFYYGKADKEWIRQRMNAVLHLAMSKDLPVDEFFIYLAPPVKNPQDVIPKQKFVKVNLVDCNSQSQEQAISELLKHLKGLPK